MSDSAPTLERRVSDALIDELDRQGIALDEFSPAIDTIALARAAIDASGNDERDKALKLIANMERIGPVSDIVAWKHLAEACQAVARRAIARTQEQSGGE